MCEWCGHEHDQRALCTKRPTWGRRGFLALLGAAAVGAALPAPSVGLRGVVHFIDRSPGPARVGVLYMKGYEVMKAWEAGMVPVSQQQIDDICARFGATPIAVALGEDTNLPESLKRYRQAVGL